MRRPVLDRYSDRESPIHRLPAGAKLLLSLALVVATATLPPARWRWLVGLGLGLAVVVVLSRVPLRFVLRRLLLLEPLALGVAGLTLLEPDGGAMFWSLMGRSTACLLVMILLSSTTPTGEILHLLRRVGVPALMVTTLALMVRYLFVLLDEAERMRRARAGRTFLPLRRGSWLGGGILVGQLFARSNRRAEQIYAAMQARGWK